MNQSRMVTMNHGRDLTGDVQVGTSHENHLASMLIPAPLSSNQCGALFEEGNQCGEIVRAILMAQ